MSARVKQFLKETIDEDLFGNSMASHHVAGRLAFMKIEQARAKAAELLGLKDSKSVIFTGSATEANNLVINGFWLRFRDRGCRVLYSAIEHKSALESCQRIATFAGCQAHEIPIDSNGNVDLDVLKTHLKDNPKRLPTLVVMMHTNNEIPVRFPVESISELCQEHRAYFHCDAVQGIVRERIQVDKQSYGSLVISPHKFYGPKGVGILCLSDQSTCTPLAPFIIGGDQEFGMRPGTLNTHGILASIDALKELDETRANLVKHMTSCQNAFISTLQASPKFHRTIPTSHHAPGIVNFYLENWDALTLLSKLSKTCINRGASCTGAGGEKFSHVPRALGLPLEIQANVLRASFGWGCSVENAVEAAREILDICRNK